MFSAKGEPGEKGQKGAPGRPGRVGPPGEIGIEYIVFLNAEENIKHPIANAASCSFVVLWLS